MAMRTGAGFQFDAPDLGHDGLSLRDQFQQLPVETIETGAQFVESHAGSRTQTAASSCSEMRQEVRPFYRGQTAVASDRYSVIPAPGIIAPWPTMNSCRNRYP